MAADRLTVERIARWLTIGLTLGLLLATGFTRWLERDPAIEIHARVAEAGGWGPTALTFAAGQPIRLRLVSDDVMHGFAIGQSETPAIDLLPGQMVETTLTFTKPGKYVFYCTRWCGLNHWRMRGTIEVTGADPDPAPATPPLYVTLGLNIDKRPTTSIIPNRPPSAMRGWALRESFPDMFFSTSYYRAHAPIEVWQTLRADQHFIELSEDEVWDLVAFVWQANSTPAALIEGQALYAANCAACHGETGRGDGVMATSVTSVDPSASLELGYTPKTPRDFADPILMLSASPALLQGKIIRGGMGTGMPYWGPIFTEAQTWALVDYLWTFQFQETR